MTDAALVSLSISRRFEASAERVFDAWLKPETAAKWLFTTPGSESHSTELDARVGGKWTIIDTREGVAYTALGEYLEIDRPRRLVFSFGMPQFSPGFNRVIVEIAPEGEGCILTLTQENLPQMAVEGLTHGWNAMFDGLAGVLK
jgi:uncharacterized protein YndB with AHSA1/START domain